MQANTATRRPVASRRQATAIPYPDLPRDQQSGSPIFWRAAWIRDMAEVEAMRRLNDSRASRRMSQPLRNAIYSSVHALKKVADESFKHLVDCNGLLYAWLPEGGAQ